MYGFEVERLQGGQVKVIFPSNDPVRIKDWKKGEVLKFISVSNPRTIKEYFPEAGAAFDLMLNTQIYSKRDGQHFIKGEAGGYLIFEGNF
jgi:hypothetical protein